MKRKRVGVFGGSFNPIHTGHVQLAKAMIDACRLDEMWLMVSPQNPLKRQRDLQPDALRYHLAQRAVAGIGGVVACDFEFHLPRPSYTWTTLCQLSNQYPDCDFTLIIGGDNWATFQRWYHWQDILRQFDVAVYPRDGHPGTVSVPLLDVSSTEVRRRVRCGESIVGLVPECIRAEVESIYAGG